MVNPSPSMKIAQERRIKPSAAAAASHGLMPRAARLPIPISRKCDHEAEPFQRQAECDKARGDNEDRPQPRQCAALGRPVAVGFAQSLHQNDGAEPHQNPAQQPRHVAGAHAQRRADRIIAREPQPERRDTDEHEPGQHVLAREDAQRGLVKSGGGSHAALGLIALS
jgi:hypothetical protein